MYVSVDLHHSMDFSDDGVVFNVTMEDVMDEEQAVTFALQDHVEDVIANCRELADARGLYNFAHEFTRLAEVMREKAEQIEDSGAAIADLYDAD